MRRKLRRILLLAVIGYSIYGAWRVFPRFNGRLIGSWTVLDISGPHTTITFFQRGGGHRGNVNGDRRFRWWTCGNVLVMHPDRGSLKENIQEAAGYALRTLFFMGPPHDVAEFDIVRLELDRGQFDRRRLGFESGVTETLAIGR